MRRQDSAANPSIFRRMADALQRTDIETMTDPSANPVEDLARELWEAHATHHAELSHEPAQAWGGLDAWTQNHWRMLARVALAFANAQR